MGGGDNNTVSSNASRKMSMRASGNKHPPPPFLLIPTYLPNSLSHTHPRHTKTLLPPYRPGCAQTRVHPIRYCHHAASNLAHRHAKPHVVVPSGVVTLGRPKQECRTLRPTFQWVIMNHVSDVMGRGWA